MLKPSLILRRPRSFAVPFATLPLDPLNTLQKGHQAMAILLLSPWPPELVTSPTWGHPTPCKWALRYILFSEKEVPLLLFAYDLKETSATP